jgi:hypothetical protein
LAKTSQVALAIIIVEKARQPIVAPLHDVPGNAGQIEAGKACRGRKRRGRAGIRPSVHAAHRHQTDTLSFARNRP